jgi:hypothetical protein
MKLLFAVVPWLLLGASAFSFVMGTEWVRIGDLNHATAGHDPMCHDLGDAFRAVGFALECVGVVGALVALGLLGAGYQFKAHLKRIRTLENEMGK